MAHKTLIIPDIHHKFKVAEEIIADEGPDMTVFLGDYFDDFGDTPEAAGMTADWLADSLERGRNDGSRVHMVGNHDLQYMTGGNGRFLCSGYSDAKRDAIDVAGIDWGLLRMYYWIGKGSNEAYDGGSKGRGIGWLCTHAGFTNRLFEQQRRNKSDTVMDVLKGADADLHSACDDTVSHPFLQVGHIRGGRPGNVGGLLWCDYSEFEDIPCTRQVFGHTRGGSVRHAASSDSEHYCIDTVMRDYAVCEDYDTMTIKSAESYYRR